MCLTEYNEERTLSQIRKEGHEEGRAEGRAEGMELGKFDLLVELVKDGVISLADSAARANMSISEFESKSASYAAG